MTSLRLIATGSSSQSYLSHPERRENLPLSVFGFAVNEVFNQRKASALPIADLMYGEKNGVAVGGVFRLTEAELLAKLERLVALYPDIFNINETAGINQLFRDKDDVESLRFLRHHYEKKDQVNA